MWKSRGQGREAAISVEVQQKLHKFSRYVSCRAILPDFCISHLEIAQSEKKKFPLDREVCPVLTAFVGNAKIAKVANLAKQKTN